MSIPAHLIVETPEFYRTPGTSPWSQQLQLFPGLSHVILVPSHLPDLFIYLFIYWIHFICQAIDMACFLQPDHVRKRAEDLLKLSRHQLRTVEAIFTGHAPVRGHLYIMCLFDADPTCRFCRMENETVQHIICGCKALARQRYDVFGKLTVEPKDTNTASVRDLCLFIWGTGLLNLCWMEYLGLYNKPKAVVHPERKLTALRRRRRSTLTLSPILWICVTCSPFLTNFSLNLCVDHSSAHLYTNNNNNKYLLDFKFTNNIQTRSWGFKYTGLVWPSALLFLTKILYFSHYRLCVPHENLSCCTVNDPGEECQSLNLNSKWKWHSWRVGRAQTEDMSIIHWGGDHPQTVIFKGT